MKKKIKILSIMCTILMFHLMLQPSTSFAQDEAFVFNDEALKALDQSVYVNMATKTAHIDREKALKHYDFTDEELNMIQNELDNLSDDDIEKMVNFATYKHDGDVQPRNVSLIVWVSIAALGIITGTALHFSLQYMTYKEKQNLIDQCYDIGGTPKIDSGDVGGINGEPEKAWWKISNTYTFECVK